MDSDEDDYAINTVDVDDNSVYKSDIVYVAVYMGTSAGYVWVEDPDGGWVASTDFIVSGTYTVYVENDSGDYTSETFEIYFN